MQQRDITFSMHMHEASRPRFIQACAHLSLPDLLQCISGCLVQQVIEEYRPGYECMTFINVFPLASIPSVRLPLVNVTVTIVPSVRPGSVFGHLMQNENCKSAASHHITVWTRYFCLAHWPIKS